MQEDFAKEEEKIMGEFGGDPLLRLKVEKLTFERKKIREKRKKDKKD